MHFSYKTKSQLPIVVSQVTGFTKTGKKKRKEKKYSCQNTSTYLFDKERLL